MPDDAAPTTPATRRTRPARTFTYTREEFEAEVTKKAALIVKEKAIDQALAEISERLDSSNHLKAEMVTKEDFAAFTEKLNETLRYKVSIEDLGDGDFVVRHRLFLVDPNEREILHERIQADSVAKRNKVNRTEAEDRRLRRREVWALIVTGGVAMLAFGVDTWTRLHPLGR